MKVVQINSFGNLSTGNVMRELDKEYRVKGAKTWMFWGRGCPSEGEYAQNFNTKLNFCADCFATRFNGRVGFHSKSVTRRLIRRLDKINPDIVHLHNLHGYYINIEILFEWLARHHCQVKWTLHDCWAFTGHCAYFTYVQCEQWHECCAGATLCPQLSTYPKTFSRKSVSWSYARKRELFTLLPIERMVFITPSLWLKRLVTESFLSKYPVEVRYNNIDKAVFKPTSSDFRERFGIGNRFMILGVASTWSKRKGLRDFLRLAKDLDRQCAVVLIGLTKHQIKALPENILGISRINSQQELAGIYTTADVFFNPTREDNYPTVNLEAQNCGTFVLTYDTGGCRETIKSRQTGQIVESNTLEEAFERIIELKKKMNK